MRARMVRVVAVSEYSRRIRKRGYLLSALLVPLLVIIAAVIAVYLSSSAESVSRPIGVVDQVGVLGAAQPLPDEGAPTFVIYPDADSAVADVNDGSIEAAFVIAPDYLATRQVTSYSVGDLPQGAQDGFRQYLLWNLAAGLPDDVRGRAIEGTDLVVRSLDGRREFSESSWLNLVIPYVAAILFFVTVMSSASEAVRSVVDEKESRTMEILVTSVSPDELMAGKITALFALGATQLLAWTIAAAVAFVAARTHYVELSSFRVDWGFLALVVAMFLPAYALTASLLAAAGAITTDLREAQQLATLVTLPSLLPAMLSAVIMRHPNGPASVLLTLFPLTAPLTVTTRWAFTPIPTWQVVASFALLVASAIGSVFLAARVFQAGMLRYGRRLSWDEVRSAVGGRSQ